jgi:transcriptional regulator with XRE-family HTH domain
MGLGAVLKRNRLQQKDVAEALGISRMTVWAWVHGKSVPTGTNLLRLVGYLRQFEPALQEEALLAGDEAPA